MTPLTASWRRALSPRFAYCRVAASQWGWQRGVLLLGQESGVFSVRVRRLRQCQFRRLDPTAGSKQPLRSRMDEVPPTAVATYQRWTYRAHAHGVSNRYIARSPSLGEAAFQCWWCSKAAWLTKPPLSCMAASASASSNDPPNATGQLHDSIVSTACRCCVRKPVKTLPCVLAPRGARLTTSRQPSAGRPHT